MRVSHEQRSPLSHAHTKRSRAVQQLVILTINNCESYTSVHFGYFIGQDPMHQNSYNIFSTMFPLRLNVKVILTVALVVCYSISFRFTIAAEIQQSQQQQLQLRHQQQRQQPPQQQQQQQLSQQQFSKNYKYIYNETASPKAITNTNSDEFLLRRIVSDTDSRHNHQTSSYNNNNNSNHISNSSNKKDTSALHNQTLNKLLRYLNRRQQELIKRYPGSLLAVARALKMAIYECQYQMRHELWDCPVYAFSVKPTEMFGKLISRSFKEASFIHALLSSAIAHSIARACTESMIITCGGKGTRDGGYREDIEFGLHFAQQFMEATHEMQSGLPSLGSFATNSTSINAIGGGSSIGSTGSSTNSIDWNPNNNIIATGSGELNNAVVVQHNQHQQHQQATSGGQMMESTRRERKIRNMINAHNDEAGRLHVFAGMRRECRCHGASGSCSMQTCWVKLPPFREVASKLHDSLDQAIRVIYVTHNPTKYNSLTSTSAVEKSNKKRSSSVNPVNGLTRLSPPHYEPLSLNSLTSDTASIIGSRQRGAKRRLDSADDCEDCYRAPANNGADNSGTVDKTQPASATTQEGLGADQSNWNSLPIAAAAGDNAPMVKKRPVARSIGTNANRITPSKLDLLFYEESPDFCVPSERYNIKGTKGRICSESPNEVNSCKTLCCGRGYKTEVREDRYKCECQFEYCCKLNCKTCTRRKVIHKCL